jgi:hypothetical protein
MGETRTITFLKTQQGLTSVESSILIPIGKNSRSKLGLIFKTGTKTKTILGEKKSTIEAGPF